MKNYLFKNIFTSPKNCIRIQKSHWATLLIIFACTGNVFAQEHQQNIPPLSIKSVETQHSPRIALVLGGGGARGAAHIGVLEVLEHEHIPIACIVGTSMGGLVAGAYAAGLSPSEMREKLDKADWTDLFLDSADYSQLSYRKKRVTKQFLPSTEFGVTKHGLQYKSGFIAGTKIKLFFNQLIGADHSARNIEDLTLPVAIVSTDIGTGKKFVFTHGSLSLAMRASMSFPGVMDPVNYQGHKLVDGALVENLPIATARELCNPDVIIAVNVDEALKPADQINSLVSVTGQMITILTKQNIANSIADLNPQDILLTPPLGDFAHTDFANYRTAADIGKATAEAAIEKLKPYSVDEAHYVAWHHAKNNSSQDAIRIDEIVISPLKHQPSAYFAEHIHQKVNHLLNREQLDKDLINLYGDGFYDNVDYNIKTIAGKNILYINAAEKKTSADSISLGFDLSNEYRQGTSFDFRLAYRNTWINRYGGEFFGVADIGSKPGLTAEFYQPLNYQQTYFIQPSFYHQTQTLNIFSNDDKIAEYKLNTSYSELALGRNMGIYGQTKIGWREYNVLSNSDISATNFQNYHEKYGGLLVDISTDTLNRLHFPSRGWSAHINYFDSQTEDYAKFSTELNGAIPVQNFVLAGRITYTHATHGVLPPFDSALLGGFLNLSAYASNQIIADDALYAHVRGEQIIGRMPLGFSGDLRLGLALEGARLQNAYTFTDGNGRLNSAVIYLGGETPLGPVYLGLGVANHGRFNIYMQIGAN